MHDILSRVSEKERNKRYFLNAEKEGKHMRKSRKLMSILLVVAMLFTLAAPAMAAPANTTISVDENDNRTYAVYQIFTGELHNGVLSNIKWGKNGTETEGEAVNQDTLTALEGVNGVGNTYQQKLGVIKQYVNLGSEPIATVSRTKSATVPTGYYLFVDKGVAGENGNFDVPDKEALSLYVVNVVGPTEIEPKRGTVESQKKVKDTNDSVANSTTDWQDSADYDIGDAVPFQLKGTVPADYANYKTYYYAFHDTESDGLDFIPGSVEVFVDGVEIESGFEVVTTGLNDGCTFEVRFANLKAITSVQAGSVITVEYTSTLNANAKLGSEGNPNEMYLEYSNNPNWEGTGKGPTGETPKDKVIVFTYKVVANKVTQKYENGQAVVDKDGKPVYEALAGAGFTLFKKDATGTYQKIGEELTGVTTFEWKGLDDGDYKLVESTTPPGYNTIDPIEFTISAEHDILSDNPALTSLTGGDLFTGEVSTGILTTDVVNDSGATLPETGGIGTTIFYVLGAVLVLGAGIVLVTRKRMAE